MKVAAIDLGTNTTRLLVAEVVDGRIDELHRETRITRLGEGVDARGRLLPVPIARVRNVLSDYRRTLESLGAERTLAVATSAVRDAENGEAFLGEIEWSYGFATRLLSGDEEAELTFRGAALGRDLAEETLLLDIGGGSTEFVVGGADGLRFHASLDLGSVRLTERFLPGSGPAKKKELQRLRGHVRDAVAELDWLPESGPRLLGTGGAIRNLAAAAHRAAEQLDIGVQGFVITRETLSDLVEKLADLPVSERGEIPGIKPGRGDIILAAALTIETVLDVGGFAGIEITEAGLRDGVFLARVLLANGEALFDDVREAAVRNLAIQYESDMTHVEHVASEHRQQKDV